MRDDTTDNYDPNDLEKEKERNTKIPGNTLDYYNEDLTRNAVQGLFTPGETTRRRGKDEPMVAGYEEDNLDVKPSPPRKRRAQSLQDMGQELEERPPRTPRKEPVRGEEGAMPKRHVRREENAAPKRSARPLGVGSRNEKIEDIDYDRYRVHDRYRLQQDEKKEPAGAAARTRPVNREKEELPPPQKAPQRPSQETSQRAPYTTFKREPYRAKPLTADGPAEEFDDDQDESLPFTRIIIISVAVVVLIIFAALIFKINSTNKKLEEATIELAQYKESGDYNTIRIQLEEATTKNLELQAQLDEYKSSSVASDNAENAQNNEENQDSQASQATGDVIHIVMSGEALSTISSKYYGTIQGVQKIKDANGLTSDNLSIGQELTIPDVPSDGQ